MLEFAFFHPTPQQVFIDWLQEQNLQPQSRIECEAHIVLIPEDLDDDLYERIDEKYESLIEMNEEIMIEEHADEEGYHMAGISIQLQDGRISYADIDPGVMARAMECITAEEFATIVDTIVNAVENPQELSYCQRQRNNSLD